MAESVALETHEIVILSPDGAFFLGDGQWFSEHEIPEEIPVYFSGNEVAILGDRDEEVPIVVELLSSSPVTGDLSTWHTVVEGSLMLPEDRLPISTITQDFALHLPGGPGHYRIRIHARSTGSQSGLGNIRSPRHRISLWPVEGEVHEPVLILKEAVTSLS